MQTPKNAQIHHLQQKTQGPNDRQSQARHQHRSQGQVLSGLGGIYPRGILVGTVLQQLDATSGWTRTYLVRPAVRPSDITSVMILSSERNAEGVESVWAPAVQALTHRVVAAGDSLAQRARDSTATVQRQRLLDSLAALAPVIGSLPPARPDTVP